MGTIIGLASAAVFLAAILTIYRCGSGDRFWTGSPTS
jgi:hypothetical protein